MVAIGSTRVRKNQIGPITIKVKLPRAFGMRVHLMIGLLKLAGWVSPVPLEVDLRSDQDDDLRVLEFDDDGLPQEAAVFAGYGVPTHWLGPGVEVLLDGEAVPLCIAFSRPEGWAWQYVTDSDGCFVRSGGDLKREKLTGVVTLRRVDPITEAA